MKVLVVGGGGREMALVLHLCQRHEVYSAAGSDAIKTLVPQIAFTDYNHLALQAKDAGIELTIVGPEAPLAEGIVDIFQAQGLTIFGPTKAAAQIESSKAFAKQIMLDAGVPTAGYQVFTDNEQARAFLANATYPQVLKEDGLRAGKGVTICHNFSQAEQVLARLTLAADSPLLVEEFLSGFEFSLIVVAHGTRYVALPVAQDHKPIGVGNTGPNTGGMGAVSPVPRVTPEHIEAALTQVIEPTLAQMETNGTPFTGFLYAGLMQTDKGVYVIEFNARLGDPECEVVLPRLSGDLAQTALDLLQGYDAQLNISEQYCLGIVLSSPGYPGVVTKYPIIPAELLGQVAAEPRLNIVHMGTKLVEAGSDQWQAAGGRVAIVTALGDSVEDCRDLLLPLLSHTLQNSPLYWRHDIGLFALDK